MTERSVAVLAQSSELQNGVSDFFAATRNYVMAPSPAALRRAQTLRERTVAQAPALEWSVRDNREQALAARLIAGDVRSLVEDWAAPLLASTHRPGGPARAREVVQESPQGRNRMAVIRLQFEHFNTREKGLGLVRGQRSRDHAQAAAVTAVSALVALVLAIVALVLLLARSISLPVRRLADAAARLGGGDLSTRVPESGQAEIGELARSFNAMAGSMRDARDELGTQNGEREAQQVELGGALEQLAAEKEQVDELRRFIELVAGEKDPQALADLVLAEIAEHVDAPSAGLPVRRSAAC